MSDLHLDTLLAVPASAVCLQMGGDTASVGAAVIAWRAARVNVRRVRGAKMRTTQALMDEVSAALQCPGYFGENWAALDECSSDMDWLLPSPSKVLLVDDAAVVFEKAPEGELKVFVDALRRASAAYASPIDDGEWWDRPSISFHVVLRASGGHHVDALARWVDAGAALKALPEASFQS